MVQLIADYLFLRTGQHYRTLWTACSLSNSNYLRRSTIWDTNTQAFISDILNKEPVLDEEMEDKNMIRTILEDGQGN